ncbi:uncharacterized protein LOC128678028 [Plodia interpunctella]|uniref:uncharacterized protein LOC128678028 n=1 Tax=Plodia interpunctella TaxID=58824 RepID=UPI002368AF0B|nr:uncharacterized protein LOC128678028 [Plodia interpunctella]
MLVVIVCTKNNLKLWWCSVLVKMEANKENVHRLKAITRIPLPIEPLPALPKHLVESKRTNSKKVIQNERHPLKTINNDKHPQLSLPGTSKPVNMIVKQKNMLKLDTRFVTVRPKEDVQWSYNVFKDDKKRDSIILISDDENEECVVINVDKKQRTSDARTAETPALKSTLEPNRVKNIKRSLKRPHSRELQGLSPVSKEPKKGDEKVRRRLSFTETIQDKLMSPDFWKKAYMKCLCREYTEDMFHHLLSSEKKIQIPKISSTMRACVVNWLMKINGPNGNPAIVQTASWYLNSVLSNRQVPIDQLQLVAAACYWIAHKLQGPGLHAQRLVKYSNHAFTTRSLLYAEKAVLERLKYPRHPIVPQDFITYLSWWCDSNHPGEIEVGATFLCMCGVMADKQLSSEYPSVIAAAAVKNALLLLRKVELIPRLQNCPVFKTAESKAESLSQTCSLLRRAARAIASVGYEYRAPFEQYGVPPHYIAHRILNAATESTIYDARNTANLH